jgi:hypothetical protein
LESGVDTWERNVAAKKTKGKRKKDEKMNKERR